MRTQLQAISLRIQVRQLPRNSSSPLSSVLTIQILQTVRSNEQMMQSMKGATMLLGSMNRQMNLPALQRIAMEFERENEVMDERQEMMDDAIDEATGMEGEEEEGEDIVKEVLDEIGVDLGSAVRFPVPTQSCTLCADQVRTSSVKPPQIYINRKLPPRLQLHKPWVLVAAEATRATTIYRQGWTASDDDDQFCFHALQSS